jgi:hypothetical protein
VLGALPLTLALTTLTATAAPRVAVVEPATPSTLVALGTQVAQWVVQAAQAQGRGVMGPEELARTLGENVYAQLQACRGDPACIGALRLPLRADRLVVGSLDRDDQSYLVRLRLLEMPSGRVVAELDRAVRIATRRLGPEVRTALPSFLRGQAPRSGSLELSANVDGAQLEVDGAPAGVTPIRLSLSPGRHEISLEKSGYLAARRWVSVEAGKVTHEEVRLLRMPGVEDSNALPAAPNSVTRASTTSRSPVPLGTYIAGGVAVAALGVGLGLGISSAQIERRLHASYDPATQVYGGTRADALTARGQALAANILFGAAGAAALTALGFLLFTPGPESAHALVEVSPTGASVGVGGQF